MATILQLLQALNRGDLPNLPPPARPLPLGPIQPPNVPVPYFGAEPDIPPEAPMPALDMDLVSRFAGAAPAAPAPRSRGERIANALAGFGAGFRGQGAEFLEQLDQPRRAYEAQLERYQGRRAQGVELAERKRERQQEQATRRAMAQADREFELYKQRSGITDKLALQQLDQAHEMAKLREAERIADERLERQQRAQQERDARLIARDYGKLTDNPKIALELGRYYAGLTDKLSPEAAKFESVQNKLAEARALRLAKIAAGGGGASGKTIVELVDAAGNPLGRMPYSQIEFGEFGQVKGFPKGTQVRFIQQQGQQPAPQPFPETSGLPPGIGALTPQGPTEEDVRGYAKKFKMSREQARKELTGR